MIGPNYCPRCGCYIPEILDACPACGGAPKVEPKISEAALTVMKSGCYKGYSWQPKPLDVPTGAAFYEVDTGDVYLFHTGLHLWIRAGP